MPKLIMSVLFLLLIGPAYAGDAASKFTVSGDTLRYDTESDAANSEIEIDDVEALRNFLRVYVDITTLRLNSSGGSVWAGDEMARIVLDYELTTVVDGECSSSCVNVFLAGVSRQMARGSKMGFHSRNWSSGAIENYYDKWAEDEGWGTPFEFSSWIYADTQAETYDDLVYLVERGVDAGFAIKTKAPRISMWFPSRRELRNAGVLTE
jgi:hypothetical protein